MSHTEIYRTLRDNKDKNTNEILNESDIDRVLVKFILHCERCMKQYPPKTKKTNDLLCKAKELFTYIEQHYSNQ